VLAGVLGIGFSSRSGPEAAWAKKVMAVLLVVQALAGWLAVDHFTSVQEYNREQIYGRTPEGEYMVACQEYNRQWHHKHDGMWIALFTEADPVFDALWFDGSPGFDVSWENDTTVHVQGLAPARHFQIYAKEWLFDFDRGDEVACPGYTVVIGDVFFTGRPRSFHIHFKREQLNARPVYIGDGARFRRLAP
jgi:hypothetical protein